MEIVIKSLSSRPLLTNLSQNLWPHIIRTVWIINPAIAVYIAERFKLAVVRNEVGKLVRSSTMDVLDVPEALPFLLQDRLDSSHARDLKVANALFRDSSKLTLRKLLLLWAPVPPVIANTFFERRYKSDPLVLQYAHRVLEQHPVELTFFFVPQVVQALRYDDLGMVLFLMVIRRSLFPGYVARFIFETAKISQLFCHQIIWNMKANCYKDDAAEVASAPSLKHDDILLTPALGGSYEACPRCYDSQGRQFSLRRCSDIL
jgi:phosphatidylinositol 4-kinase